MIDTVKKILQKLINNVEKHQVNVAAGRWEGMWNHQLVKDYWVVRWKADIHYSLSFNSTNNIIEIVTQEIGGEIKIDVPEDNKYEILDLCQKLKKACKECISNKLEAFADFSATDDNSDLND